MEIGAIIRSRREVLGMTLEDLARKIGVNKSTISRWETGDIDNMRREKIGSLADALEISPMVILGRENVDLKTLQEVDTKKTAEEIIKLLDEEDIKLIKELKDSDDEKAKMKLYAMLINKISQL